MRIKRANLIIFIAMSVAIVSVLFFRPTITYAATGINPELSFEGKIVTSSGINIPNGTYNMEFKIYSGGTSTGGGTLVWTEDYLVGGSGGVTFNSGTFQVNLGSVTPFGSSVNWNSYPLYLSMQIGNTSSCSITTTFQANCGGDGEMTPYILLTATPYSMNSNELDGLASTAFGQLGANQSWTGNNTFQSATNSTNAFQLQNSSGTNILTANTTNGRIGIGTSTPVSQLNVESSTYQSGQVIISDGTTGSPPAYPNSFEPSLVVQTSETTGSRPLFFGYNNAGSWGALLTSGACGSFSQMCLDLGDGTSYSTALENSGSTLNVGGGSDGNFSNINLADNTSIAGQLSIGTASSTNGQATFASSGGANTAAIAAPTTNPTTSYVLSLPIAAPATSQCLEAGATIATQLIFGSCSGTSGSSGGVTSVGALDGETANSYGATISSATIYLQSASASYPGLVNTTTQTFAGNKTFSGTLTVSGASNLDSTLAVTGATTLSSTLSVSGIATFAGGAAFSSFLGGTWINLPTTGASGIGSGGAGANAWLGYVAATGQWFTNAPTGDIAYRNTSGGLDFGNTSGSFTMTVRNSEVGINLVTPTTLLDVNGPIATAISTQTVNYTITSTDSTILADGAITITLPSASGIAGRQYTIKNISSSTVTVASNGGTIDDSTTLSLTSDNEAITVQSDGTNWYVINEVGTTIL